MEIVGKHTRKSPCIDIVLVLVQCTQTCRRSKNECEQFYVQQVRTAKMVVCVAINLLDVHDVAEQADLKLTKFFSIGAAVSGQ